jgi:hypothetical protein
VESVLWKRSFKASSFYSFLASVAVSRPRSGDRQPGGLGLGIILDTSVSIVTDRFLETVSRPTTGGPWSWSREISFLVATLVLAPFNFKHFSLNQRFLSVVRGHLHS